MRTYGPMSTAGAATAVRNRGMCDAYALNVPFSTV